MDRDTIKNLLMTTSVLAIIAGTGEEAKATNTCTTNISGAQASVTATNVNCINITNAVITGDVTVPTNVIVGAPPPTTVATNTVIRIDNSTISGAVNNTGTITGTANSALFSQLKQFGIHITGGSIVGNGVTNGSTGVINVSVTNTDAVTPEIGTGAGIDIGQLSFAGNVVNNGAIDVAVVVDPTLNATALAEGMAVHTTSFVGNVINTNAIAVSASAIAGPGVTAVSGAHADGITITVPSATGSSTFTAGTTLITNISASFIGNISNSGAIAVASAALSTAITGGPGATAVGSANGILVGGPSFSGSLTDTGTGTVASTFTEVFTGNISNTNAIAVASQATADQGGAAPVLSTANATADDSAFGIHVFGGAFTGSITSGMSTSIGNIISNTLISSLHSNITNSDVIAVDGVALARGISTTETAMATAVADAAGIDITGVFVNADFLSTSVGGISNTFDGTFVGNIANNGQIGVASRATGTAANVSTTAMAETTLNESAAGIRFVGARFVGNVSAFGTGAIDNTLNATFTGNVTNAGTVSVLGETTGTAVTSGGTAAVVINSSNAGISVIGAEFQGNVFATAPGSVTGTENFTFNGNITNGSLGVISVFDNAFGISSLTGTNGSYFDTVLANSAGIQLIGATFRGDTSGNVSTGENVLFTGNISNVGGTITATSLAEMSLQGSNGNVDSLARARAEGIAVFGAVSSGNPLGVGNMSGSITNSGKLNAFATAVGRTTALTALSFPSFTARATAAGIRVQLRNMVGNVINTGSIGAFSTAIVTVGSSLGNSEAFARADGIDVRASTFTGSIGNSSGSIRAFATAFNNDTGTDVAAFAIANGIYADSGSFFTGNVGNTGLMVVTSNASVTPSGGSAEAFAAGINITAGESITGTIANNKGGSLLVSAIAVGNTFASATATGIAVDASAVFGDVLNNGVIEAFASATALSGASTTAVARAAGIHVGDFGAPMSSFIGNINNTGVMTAFATAATPGTTAVAAAEGIIVANTLGDAEISNVSIVAGNIINSGNISSGAFASSTGTAYALSAGMLLSASTFIGNVSNGGTIFAQAGAAVTTALGGPNASADAFGIAALGGTHDNTFTETFSGNVSNTSSGIITAVATALAGQVGAQVPNGRAFARSAGILVAGGASRSNFELRGVSTLTGTVTNQGLIMSTGSAKGQISAIAHGFGIDVLFSTFIGTVSNSGTISATALATVVDGTAGATAGGIQLAGTEGGGRNDFVDAASSFSGAISNSGVVVVNANAVATTGGVTANAHAFGIFVESSTVVGSITNTGVLAINATATAGHVGSTNLSNAFAEAEGIQLFTSVFVGNLTNTSTPLSSRLGAINNGGTISVNALAIAADSGRFIAGSATAHAYGIYANDEFFFGNVTNTGLIGAFATAVDTPDGLATAIADAAGIRLTGFVGVGTIANTGTLVQISTFSGNVTNAGTIMAIGTAIASSNTSVAHAFDPATGIRVEITSFFGTVHNAGQILAAATADAIGSDGGSAVALAAGLAVNRIGGPTDTLLPTSFFSGSISNAGTIMVNASAHVGGLGGVVMAGATGIRAFSTILVGNVSNSGFIQATATATNDGSLENAGTAFAAGIHIGGVFGGVLSPGTKNFAPTSFFFGNVTNSGTINAFALSTTNDNAYAAGIQVDTFITEGNIDNARNAILSAAAVVSGPGTAIAEVDGIYIHASEFVGNVSNEGTIIATATAGPLNTSIAFADGIDAFSTEGFFGNITNAGVVMAGATAFTNVLHLARASATGIVVGAGLHSGNITNTGSIIANATALSVSGAGQQDAEARGVNVIASLFIGNIDNTGGLISAKVSAPTIGSPSVGSATGIDVHSITFSGNVNNSGTVMASSDGTGLSAIGVRIGFDGKGGGTFVGNLNNSGLIIALGDATGVYSNPATFSGAINNTGTIVGLGNGAGRGIRVVGPSISGGINNSGTVQGDFASIDMDGETGPRTEIQNRSHGVLKGDVLLSAHADTLNVFGGSTVMGNISGNVSGFPGSGPHGIGNSDVVNFDLGFSDEFHSHALTNGFTVYQSKITNVDEVNLLSGTLILADQDTVGTVTVGPGNIDPVGVYNQSSGSTLGLEVDVGHPTALSSTTAPTVQTLTITSGIGSVSALTVNISTGAAFKAFEEADFYANTNIYPNVVVGLDSFNGNYAESNVLSKSPLFDAFMIENGGTGPAGSDTLVLTRRAFNHPLGVGLTPNENAAGLGLESLYKTGNSTAFAVIPTLFTVDAKDYALVLKSLDGETILERPDLWQTTLDSILHRLSQGEGFNGQGVAGAMLNHGPIQVASAGFSDADTQVAQTTPMPGPNGYVQPWSVWVRGYGVTASGDATINATSFDEKRYGGIGGIDYHVSNNLLVGGFFNYSHGEVNLDPPTPAKNKQNAYQFGAYGKYQQGPWYVNAIVGGGFTDNSEHRTVLVPTPAPVSASYNGETITAYGETGWDFYPINNVRLTPLVGVGYNWLHYDGFQETGSPSALTVQSQNTDNLYSALGARAQTAFNIGTSAPLVPEVRVVWQHEFLDANQEMNANFGGAGLFNVQGSKFSRNSIIAGVGVSNNVAPDLKVFLDYDAKIQGGYTAHAISAGLRWSFGAAAPMPPPAAPPPVPAAQPAPPPPAQAQTFVVYFDFDKSDLTPEARSIILQAATVFKQTGAVNLKVDGYTDLAGTAKYNIGLSKRRADAVRAELVRDGVANNAVTEAWHGKDNPAVPTPDGVREPRNRRATIMLP